MIWLWLQGKNNMLPSNHKPIHTPYIQWFEINISLIAVDSAMSLHRISSNKYYEKKNKT